MTVESLVALCLGELAPRHRIWSGVQRGNFHWVVTRVLTTQLIVFEGVHIEERGSEHEENRHCLRSYSAKGQLLSADHLLCEMASAA